MGEIRPVRHERSRVISANDLHVITTQFLTAAMDIHIAMCRLDDDHASQELLNKALHSALIGAGQCRQLHASQKRIIAPEPKDPDDVD